MLASLGAHIQIPHLKEAHTKNVLKICKLLLLLVYKKTQNKQTKLHF